MNKGEKDTQEQKSKDKEVEKAVRAHSAPTHRASRIFTKKPRFGSEICEDFNRKDIVH